MTDALRQEAIKVIEVSPHTITSACREVGISRSSFYRWRNRLRGKAKAKPQAWNRLLESEVEAVLQKADEKPEFSARELAFRLMDH